MVIVFHQTDISLTMVLSLPVQDKPVFTPPHPHQTYLVIPKFMSLGPFFTSWITFCITLLHFKHKFGVWIDRDITVNQNKGTQEVLLRYLLLWFMMGETKSFMVCLREIAFSGLILHTLHSASPMLSLTGNPWEIYCLICKFSMYLIYVEHGRYSSRVGYSPLRSFYTVANVWCLYKCTKTLLFRHFFRKKYLMLLLISCGW